MNLHRWKTLSAQFSAQMSQQASEQAGINEKNARSLEAIDLRLERLERLVGILVESGLRVAPQDGLPQFGTRSAAPAEEPAATEKPAAAEEPAATEQPTEPEPAALPPPPLRPPFACCLAQVSCGATGNSETLCDALSDLFYATEGAAQSCSVATAVATGLNPLSPAPPGYSWARTGGWRDAAEGRPTDYCNFAGISCAGSDVVALCALTGSALLLALP